MPRGIKGPRGKDLRTLDPSTQEYWNEVLRREGLSMDAGRDPGHRKLVYVEDVEKAMASQSPVEGRRVPPKPAAA